MRWFCGQENKLVPTGILPSDENVQTVGQCLICGVLVHVTGSLSRWISSLRLRCYTSSGKKIVPILQAEGFSRTTCNRIRGKMSTKEFVV